MVIKDKITINTAATTIFKQYIDVESWSAWDKDVLESSLDGAFKQGSYGTLKPRSDPEAKFMLAEVSTDQSFTSETKLPLCRMVFLHTLKESAGKTLVTHHVSFEGISSFLFSRVIGTSVKKGLPNALLGLKMLCESNRKEG